ncbi:hypothetical protein [Leptodesmis sichuanensis]|uniref:hypothetical protein n=1 Tax=Leptodesmis sichuanensis TaxID=2906798 RepID=UPI001F3CCFE5|nr:hypothetical protein [Leptodesmis sichuanensis]UIE37192.1 hypothetical protein KIK02_19835 [Leptodesmis sichuanensis A121]
MTSSTPLPPAVTALTTLYGAPSQAGFGSAVFYDAIEPGSDLEPIALRYYQYFVGSLWEQYGEAAWMSPWKQIYVRPTGIQPDIVAELKAIADSAAVNYVPILLLEETDDYAKAQQALATVFNHPQVTDLRVYAIGDGAAMSGLLLAGSRSTGETTILVSLLD